MHAAAISVLIELLLVVGIRNNAVTSPTSQCAYFNYYYPNSPLLPSLVPSMSSKCLAVTNRPDANPTTVCNTDCQSLYSVLSQCGTRAHAANYASSTCGLYKNSSCSALTQNVPKGLQSAVLSECSNETYCSPSCSAAIAALEQYSGCCSADYLNGPKALECAYVQYYGIKISRLLRTYVNVECLKYMTSSGQYCIAECQSLFDLIGRCYGVQYSDNVASLECDCRIIAKSQLLYGSHLEHLDVPLRALMDQADLKSAFRMVPVSPDDWNLLSLHWKGKFYMDTCLPFGLRSARHLFNHFAEAIIWILLSNNAAHWPIWPASLPELCSSIAGLVQQSWCPGVALDKLEDPASTLTFLGITLDTVNQELRLPADKLKEISQAVTDWLGRHTATKRELLSLIGSLAFAARVVPAGHLFCQRLIHLSSSVDKLHHHVYLNAEAVKISNGGTPSYPHGMASRCLLILSGRMQMIYPSLQVHLVMVATSRGHSFEETDTQTRGYHCGPSDLPS
eukprot:Em0004g478a